MTRLLLAALALTLALGLLAAGPAAAQSRTAPLSMEGAHHRTTPSAAVVGAGSIARLVPDHAAVLFRDPAALATLSGLQVSVGGAYRDLDRSQVQHYAPVRYYPNLSVLLEGLTDLIPNPPPGTIVFTPADSVQRANDAIGPNWERAARQTVPLQGFVAAPFDLGAVRVVAGLGVAEYGDFGYFYQNNNVLSPDILAQRPLPLPRPTDDNPLEVDWHQVVRQREGTVMGYGGALAVTLPGHGLTLAASGTLVRGSTDDREEEVARGRLTFYANNFQLDSLQGQTVRAGRSEFSGFDTALSAELRGEFVSIGTTVRLPMTLSRQFSLTGDAPAGAPALEGTDAMRMPWRGSAAIALTPRPDLALGMELEARPLARAEYRPDAGEASAPWLSSTAFRFGVAYDATSWLALRGGLRREAQPYGADGRPIETDPVWATAHTVGVGLSFAGAQLNLAAETARANYEDVMGTAIHYNRERRLMLVADLVYGLNRAR